MSPPDSIALEQAARRSEAKKAAWIWLKWADSCTAEAKVTRQERPQILLGRVKNRRWHPALSPASTLHSHQAAERAPGPTLAHPPPMASRLLLDGHPCTHGTGRERRESREGDCATCQVCALLLVWLLEHRRPRKCVRPPTGMFCDLQRAGRRCGRQDAADMMLLRLGVGSASLHAMQETKYASQAGCGRQDAEVCAEE